MSDMGTARSPAQRASDRRGFRRVYWVSRAGDRQREPQEQLQQPQNRRLRDRQVLTGRESGSVMALRAPTAAAAPRRAGYDVVDAPTGKEGMRLYREAPADLIITDIMMPGEDGLEVIRELQGEFPDIKIIAISGGDMKGRLDYLSFAEEFGALRAFSKPFDPKALLAAVKELVDQG